MEEESIADEFSECLEAEQERISRAEEYCEGYNYGVYAGRKYSASEADSGGPCYRAGFARGVAAANRARYGESSVEQNAKEIISDAIARLEPGSGFATEEEAKRWISLQATIKADGEKSWQDLLLELYHHLGLYQELASSATYEERAATGLVRTGVVKRLAKTSLVLPVPG